MSIIVVLLVWSITVLLSLAVVGGAYKLASEGFNWNDFISLVVLMIILVVFGTIAFTGSFSI